jgi:NDP-sugar pyrophosphorylase family protein
VKALLLAAGKGSRLSSAAAGLPKPLVDLGGITPLEHSLEWVMTFGVSCIWINVHDAAALIEGRIGNEYAGVQVRYSAEPQLLGTAGAWKKLEKEWSGTSLVVYGDNFMRFDLDSLLHAHRSLGTTITVALFDPAIHANTGAGGGRAEVNSGRISRFVEGGDAGLINAGAYFVEPALAMEMAPGYVDFGHDVLPRLATAGRVGAHVVEQSGYCLGIDTPERLAVARALVGTLEVRP